MNHRPDSDSCRDPFDDLLDAVVSGDASARDLALFNDTLRADPAARRAYIHTMAFEAMLAREFAPADESHPAIAARPNRWLAPAAIAATIMLAATLAWRIRPEPAVPLTTAAARPVARDGGAVHPRGHHLARRCQRAVSATPRSPRGCASREDCSSSISGLAEITFDSGAEVTLEGPARLQLESETKTRLDAGRASAEVPEQARGFVIHTPYLLYPRPRHRLRRRGA